MKNILLISTGGTIASTSTDEGLSPTIGPDEILRFVPSVKTLSRLNTLSLFRLDSTNIEPRHWLMMAQAIRENYDDYDGFLILHGTDTMSYTAAALSYLIQGSPKPIVITGSQRPISSEVTDAKRNLFDSILYAVDDNSHGVCLVFDGQVIAGTRAKKSRTKSFNAFSSVDFPNLAEIRGDHIVRYISDPTPGGPVFYSRINDRVCVLKLTPGMNPAILSHLDNYCDALIIESFGVGGIPCYQVDSFMSAIEGWLSKDKLLVMTTQVAHEGSDMGIYKVGLRVKQKYDVLEAYDMTLEAALTKLMWILGQTTQPAKVRSMFYSPVNHDIII